METATGHAICGNALLLLSTAVTFFGLQVALDFKLALPQVAVVGSQSSGKSSVLEALVRQVTRVTRVAPSVLACIRCGKPGMTQQQGWQWRL